MARKYLSNPEKIKLDPNLKEAWCQALRSGRYRQGKEALCTRDGAYCCLGVLAEEADLWNYQGARAVGLPDALAATAGLLPSVLLDMDLQDELAVLNDGSDERAPLTFAEIAAIIDREL